MTGDEKLEVYFAVREALGAHASESIQAAAVRRVRRPKASTPRQRAVANAVLRNQRVRTPWRRLADAARVARREQQ